MITIDASEFACALPGRGRLIALDVGAKTIGTAMCDARWTIATPASLITRSKFAVEKAQIIAIIGHEDIEGFVIGLPLNLDASDSARTQSTRAFARNLEAIGLPILLWDERWSTAAVERQMIAADVSRAKRAQMVDSAAAAYILQGAVDRLATIAG